MQYMNVLGMRMIQMLACMLVMLIDEHVVVLT
jgi:hypothetical protein